MMSTSYYALLACVACACALTSVHALDCWECNAPGCWKCYPQDKFGVCDGYKDTCADVATPNEFCMNVTYPDGRKVRACGNTMAAMSEGFDFQDGCHNVTSAGALKDGLYCRCSDKDYCNEGRREEGLMFEKAPQESDDSWIKKDNRCRKEISGSMEIDGDIYHGGDDKQRKKRRFKKETYETTDDKATSYHTTDYTCVPGENPDYTDVSVQLQERPAVVRATNTTGNSGPICAGSTSGTASHRMGAAVTVLLCPAIVMLVL